MNTKALARHYDQLTPHERLPLIIAASARGDEVEAERLARSAPRRTFALPDYHGLADALRLLALAHTAEQLHHACLFRQVEGLIEQAADPDDRSEAYRARIDRLLRGHKVAAYVLVAHDDGWRHFCAGLGIDPEVLLADLPWYETAARAVRSARHTAFTADEVAAFVGGDRAAVLTADKVASGFREAQKALAEHWD
jgi:hypothetical protein